MAMRYSGSKKTVKSVTPDEFKLLVQNTRKNDKAAKVAFLLAYGAGLRLAEVLNLKKDNIKTHVNPPVIEVREGKGNKDRTVPLPKGWRQWMFDELPIKKKRRAIQQNFKTAAKRANLDSKYSFHSLRHGFGTRLIESGVPINQVQILMGHSDLSTTSVYLKARPMDAIKSYEDLF